MRNPPTLFILSIAILMLIYISPTIPKAHAIPGSSFDHIVIIAMENQNYGSVIGNPNAPFINSTLRFSSVAGQNYAAYGASGRCISHQGGCTVPGFATNPTCSAACYTALIGAAVCYTSLSYNGGCVQDQYCQTGPCITAANLTTELTNAGFTYKAY